MVTSNGLIQSRHNLQTGNRVEHVLLRADKSAFRRIDVLAFYGIIELSGAVANFGDKRLAVRLAQRVRGVTTVIESLRVATPTRIAELCFAAEQKISSFSGAPRA
jgi:osmotically-inducible protein OsmY